MQTQDSDVAFTQRGQAININLRATSLMSEMFTNLLGDDGNVKMLINPSGSILIKDGGTLCKEIQFIHPTSIFIANTAKSLADTLGDGISTFIVLTTDLFLKSTQCHFDGMPIHRICRSLQLALNDASMHIGRNLAKEADESSKKRLLQTVLSSKIDSQHLARITNEILKSVDFLGEKGDINMIEIIKMSRGTISESGFLKGLVLDHGGRHPLMPVQLSDAYIMITNISLEYEKTEINSEFYYKDAGERDEMVMNERKFIFEKAVKIAKFAKYLSVKHGKSFILITEKGIDQISLEVLADAKILGLRRAKRRNLERLLRMCGGNIITNLDDLKVENLGYCRKSRVEKCDDDIFTFIEEVPFNDSCTFLIRGDDANEMKQLEIAIRQAFKVMDTVRREKLYVKGGILFFNHMRKWCAAQSARTKGDRLIGFKIINDACESMLKSLIRNSGENVAEKMLILNGKDELSSKDVILNHNVVQNVLGNAIIISNNLLMVDEIIKSGRSVKEERDKIPGQ